MAGEEVEAASVVHTLPLPLGLCGRGVGVVEGFLEDPSLYRWEHSRRKPEREGVKGKGVGPPSDVPASSNADEESPALGPGPGPRASAPPGAGCRGNARAWEKEARRGGPALLWK